MIHLDTSFLIRALITGSRQDGQLRVWLGKELPLAMSSIVWAEFLCGPVQPSDIILAVRVISEQVPFVTEDALVAAELFNQSGRRRGSLIDCMIAATAMRAGAELATANPADFRRFEGLKIIGS